MDRAAFKFFTPVPTRWGDADMLGHINNVMYLRYLESGRLDYLIRVLGLDCKPPQEEGVILADVKITYLQQVYHPADLEVATRVSRIGNTSFDITANICHVDGETVIKSKAVCVWFNYAANHKQPIPLSVRDTIHSFEATKPL
jgi:acyl-CoA thioester hydrolase